MSSKLKAAAVLTIKDADKMSVEGKKAIAAWLRQQAKDLLKYGEHYSSRFRARYLYSDE